MMNKKVLSFGLILVIVILVAGIGISRSNLKEDKLSSKNQKIIKENIPMNNKGFYTEYSTRLELLVQSKPHNSLNDWKLKFIPAFVNTLAESIESGKFAPKADRDVKVSKIPQTSIDNANKLFLDNIEIDSNGEMVISENLTEKSMQDCGYSLDNAQSILYNYFMVVQVFNSVK